MDIFVYHQDIELMSSQYPGGDNAGKAASYNYNVVLIFFITH